MNYNHCFELSDTIYATPYSDSGNVDFMDGVVEVCSSEWTLMPQTGSLARLLSQLLFYSQCVLDPRTRVHGEGYYQYCLKKSYSLQYRLYKVMGRYAYESVMCTLNLKSVTLVK